MPRFFFHVHDHSSSPDRDGTELPDFEIMQIEAVRLVGGLLREQGYGSSPVSPLSVEVADENGMCVFRVEVGLIHPSRCQIDAPLGLAKFLK